MNSNNSQSYSPLITLQTYLDIFGRRKLAFLGVFTLIVSVGLVLTYRTPRTYQAQALFLIDQATASVQLGGSDTATNRSGDSVFEPESAAIQVRELQRPEFRATVSKATGVAMNASRLKVSVDDEGNLSLLVSGPSPQLVTKVAEAVPSLHARAMEARRRNRVKSSIQYLQEEVKIADRQVLSAETALRPYRRSDPRVLAATRDQVGARTQEQLVLTVNEAEIRRQTLQGQLALLRQRAAREPAEVLQHNETPNPRYAELEKEVAALDAQRQKLLLDFRPASDEVKAVDQQLAAARTALALLPAKLSEDVQVPNPKRLSLENRIADLESSLEGTEVEVGAARRLLALTGGKKQPVSLGQWEAVTAHLREEADAARELRSELVGRLRRLRVAAGSLRSYQVDWLTRPVIPTEPVSPQPQKDLMVTLALALLLATGAVFILEYMDDRTYSPEDVERVSPLPALGVVPTMPLHPSRHIAALPVSTAAVEAYRLVRSGISFAELDAPVRRILVTSPCEGDGKTVTSVNLATAMALDGKRVILIDADLRRPSIHRMLELPHTPGISDVLAGTHPIENALRESGTPNLRILCAGTAIPDPVGVLGSEAFGTLLEQLSRDADVLVFDSPPCLYVADSAVLSGRTDGVVLVIRIGRTRLAEISAAEAFLSRARARILGLVYNQTRSRNYYRGYAYRSSTAQDSENKLNPFTRGASGHVFPSYAQREEATIALPLDH